MTNLELNDVRTQALSRKLDEVIRNDRYFLSPRIVALKEILSMLRPEPDRPGAAAATQLRAASKGRYRRRGDGGEANCRIAGVIACPIE